MAVLIFIFIVVIIVAIFITKFKNRHKKITIANYHEILDTHIAYYQKLDEAGKIKFEKSVSSFLDDTHIEGVGTEITLLDKIMIASSAVIPIFCFPDWKYKNLTNIILYPDTFDHEYQFEGNGRNILGMVGSGYMNGQMLLSRKALVKGFSTEHGSEQAAIHEFVHLLDSSDGTADGLPENLLAHPYIVPWLHLMHVEMHKITDGKSDINPYALTNDAEFFAVAAEYFFEKPEQLHLKHPALFSLLIRIFNRDMEW